jgi:membrane protease YdiL (CAAX protease family)
MNSITAPTDSTPISTPHHGTLAAFAAITALVSLSIHGFWRGIVPGDTGWLIWAQLGLLVALLGYTSVAAQALRGFALVNLALHASNWLLFTGIASSDRWAAWFGPTTPWMQQELGAQALKLVQMLVIIGTLVLLGLRRHAFYLVKGQTAALVAPVRWLGIRRGTTWARFGPIFALVGCLVISLSLIPVVTGAFSSGDILHVLPLLPGVVLIAASNAIYEEVVYKAAPLSQLAPVVGRSLALFLVAAMFGMGHFTERYFLPGTSMIFPALLGYVLAKSMLETRGIAWAWRIHFAMDVLIFGALALASVGQR